VRDLTMRLAANTDVAVEISIVGYQFPDLHTAEYDSNWLVVRGHVHHPCGDWTFCDPCLLTYEAARLVDWLESVAAGHEMDERATFIEPNLSFEVAVTKTGRMLRITFALESRPSWASEDVVIELPITEMDLNDTIRQWRKQLERFPQRAKC
jgi:hypothetical protein